MYFFFKKPIPPSNTFPFTTDVHAHLIPGIDDGPKTISESVRMVAKMQEMGYRKLTATPHVFTEYYPNSKEEILNGLALLRKEIKVAGIDIEINEGAEYFLEDSFLELLESESLLTIKDNQLLVEMSTFGAPLNLLEILIKIKEEGYQPILAHPERYLYLTTKDYAQLLDLGCLFQINLLSANGFYGRGVQKRVLQLIKNGWAHFVGTDAHNEAQLDQVAKLVGTSLFNHLKLQQV